MVIANDHYQSIGFVCLSVSPHVQRIARKRSISFNEIMEKISGIHVALPQHLLSFLFFFFLDDEQRQISACGHFHRQRIRGLY